MQVRGINLEEREWGHLTRPTHSPGELGPEFRLGEPGLGLREWENPETHHNRHVTGLLPHLTRAMHSLGELEQEFSPGELGLGLREWENPETHHNRHVTGLLPHPGRPVCQQAPKRPSSTGGPPRGHCRVAGRMQSPQP